MLIGLASKNAILIVEFAKQRREEGLPVIEAAMQAAMIRLRPILMTAFAFILGVFPLVIASGAGARKQTFPWYSSVWRHDPFHYAQFNRSSRILCNH